MASTAVVISLDQSTQEAVRRYRDFFACRMTSLEMEVYTSRRDGVSRMDLDARKGMDALVKLLEAPDA